MKISKLLHVLSVIVGCIAIITFLGSIFGGVDGIVFGITKMDALVCTAILFLISIWALLGAMHHMMLEKQGEIV